MNYIQDMYNTHPASDKSGNMLKALTKSVLCSTTCFTCADACLSEDDPKMLEKCIRLNMDCAAVCEATTQLLSRPGSSNFDFLKTQLQACKEACSACAEECEQHAGKHKHCEVCAQACRACEQACEKVIA